MLPRRGGHEEVATRPCDFALALHGGGAHKCAAMPPSTSHRIKCIRRPGLRAWLDAAHPHADALESRLGEIASIPAGFARIPTRNRMNKVWEGRLGGIPGTVIIKQGWVNPVYPLDRRIARRVNLACRNRFLQSMELSFRLDGIGFPSVRPILCWKKGARLFPSEIGILYPKIEAPGSLLRYLDMPEDRPWGFRGLPPDTARAWGRHTRRLNEAGLLHMDPAPQNILLRAGAAEPPREDDFIYIDTDAFRPLHASPASLPGRYLCALAMARAFAFFTPGDLEGFCEGYARGGEAPSAWLRLFEWIRLHPRPHLPGKLRFWLRAAAFRGG